MSVMVIAFVGQKGGVGKSTLAIFSAAELQRRGYSVLLVDADPQGTSRTWGDVAVEEGNETPTIVAMGAKMSAKGQLDELAEGYDVVVIDCPPRHGAIQRAALMTADVAVLPCGPSPADAWALAGSLELITEALVYRADLQPCIALTKVRSNTRIAQATREALGDTGVPVLDAELGYRVGYQEAMAAGGATDQLGTAGSKEMRKFVDVLLAFATGETDAKAKNKAA